MSDVLQYIQAHVKGIKTWCERQGMEINIGKTKAMLFSHKRETSPKITLEGADVEFVKEFKILGMTFDSPGCTIGEKISYLGFKRSLNLKYSFFN